MSSQSRLPVKSRSRSVRNYKGSHCSKEAFRGLQEAADQYSDRLTDVARALSEQDQCDEIQLKHVRAAVLQGGKSPPAKRSLAPLSMHIGVGIVFWSLPSILSFAQPAVHFAYGMLVVGIIVLGYGWWKQE